MAGVDPTWIVAGITAGGAVVATYRGYRAWTSRRTRRQTEYKYLWQEVYGRPALTDDHGIEYEPAEPGICRRLDALEETVYGTPPGRSGNSNDRPDRGTGRGGR